VADIAVDYDDLFRAHYPRVVRVVQSVLGDRARAEEVAQEAFVRVYVNWSRVSGYDRPDMWVRRVAVRLAVRVARRDRMRTTLERRADEPPPPGPDDDSRGALRLLPKLPRNQRLAVVLHYVDDLPVAQVARAMGCAEPTARVHLHRGRRRLEELLAKEVGGDDG
jgi:RNA polymerase sigma-70 factor (ECF subfamily)